jgi:integrase/recombinase XerD
MAPAPRRAEIANLQIADVDKSMMRIHIREGKGGQDREVPLSPTLYQELRQHYRRLKRKPHVWLFPGGMHHTSHDPISDKVVGHACRNAAERVGLRQIVHPHTLRHYSGCVGLLADWRQLGEHFPGIVRPCFS